MEQEDTKKLAPQNFYFGISVIILAIISIVYSLIVRCRGERINYEHHIILLHIDMALTLWVLILARKYLKNFGSEKTIVWMNRNIGMGLIIHVHLVLLDYLKKHSTEIYASVGYNYYMLISISISVIAVGLVVGYFYVIIRFGNSVRAIENDYVGLLKEFGLFTIISSLLIPFAYIPAITHNPLFYILAYAVVIPPYIILIMIFLKAINHSKRGAELGKSLGITE
jgi:hypothetical protein